MLQESTMAVGMKPMNGEVHMIDFLYGVMGVMLLTLGRRLFWLFVGCVGFVVAFQIAQHYFGFQSSWIAWGAALMFGLTGALLAVFFQTLAILVGGFVAGSTIATHLMHLMGFAAVPMIYVLVGLAGAILLYVVFDWALIALSSVVGATLVVLALNWNSRLEMALSLVLIAAGVWFQISFLRAKKPKTKPSIDLEGQKYE